jgi:hypothetical protein
VPQKLEPLPPDHPIFTRGVTFVFRSDLPEPDDEQDSEYEHEDDES